MDNALESSGFMVLNLKDGILSHWIGSLTRHLALDKRFGQTGRVGCHDCFRVDHFQ